MVNDRYDLFRDMGSRLQISRAHTITEILHQQKEECLLGDLFRNEEAAGILLAAAPQAAAFNNPENSTKQICDLWELEFMGADLAAVQAAKEKIKELKFDLGTLSAQSR